MRLRPIVAGILASSTLACGPELPPGGGAEDSDDGGGAMTTVGATAMTPTDSGEQPEPTDTTAMPGTETGAEPPPLVPEACRLVRVDGDARVPIDADQVLGSRMYVLEPGTADAPPRVMTSQYEVFGSAHSNYRARSFVLESWPDGVVETRPSLPLTRDGHGASTLVRLDDGPARFAYIWTGDPDGSNKYDTFFSILDVDAWSVGGEVEVESSTNPLTIDLLRVPTSARFVATYTTDSFDTTPKGESSGFSLGVLDGGGAPLITATPLTQRTPLPGSGLRTFWAGDRVAAGIGHNVCGVDDPLCSPHSVVLARPTAPDELGLAVEGFAVEHVIAGLPGTQHVSRPQLTHEAGLTWMIWYEGTDETASDEHRSLRGLVLDTAGDPVAWPPGAPEPAPSPFLIDTAMDSWPGVLVSQFGITVAYRTSGSTYEVHHHDFEFKPIGEPIVLEFDGGGSSTPTLSVLEHPRSLLLAWSEQTDGMVSVRMVRLDCATE